MNSETTITTDPFLFLGNEVFRERGTLVEDNPLVGLMHAWEGKAWGRLCVGERETGLARRACKLGVGPGAFSA